MSTAAELQALLNCQPRIDGTAMPAFRVEDADFDAGRVVLRFAAQPAFRNYHGHVQGGFALAMVDVFMARLLGNGTHRAAAHALWLGTPSARNPR